MVNIVFVAADGSRTEIDAEPGTNIMQVALDNDVGGIIGECGGAMMCATCHCYVDDGWQTITGERKDGEEEMLDCAADEVKPASRLSCQIEVSEDMEGLLIQLPESQY